MQERSGRFCSLAPDAGRGWAALRPHERHRYWVSTLCAQAAPLTGRSHGTPPHLLVLGHCQGAGRGQRGTVVLSWRPAPPRGWDSRQIGQSRPIRTPSCKDGETETRERRPGDHRASQGPSRTPAFPTTGDSETCVQAWVGLLEAEARVPISPWGIRLVAEVLTPSRAPTVWSGAGGGHKSTDFTSRSSPSPLTVSSVLCPAPRLSAVTPSGRLLLCWSLRPPLPEGPEARDHLILPPPGH